MRIFGLVVSLLAFASVSEAQGDTAKTPIASAKAQPRRAGLPFYDKAVSSKQLYAWLVENGGSKNGVSLYASPEEILVAWKKAFPEFKGENLKALADFIRQSNVILCPNIETNLAYVDKDTRKVVMTGWRRTLGAGDNEGEMCLERYGRIYASLLCGNIIPRLWIETTPAPVQVPTLKKASGDSVSFRVPISPQPTLRDTIWIPKNVYLPRESTRPIVETRVIRVGFPWKRTIGFFVITGTAGYYVCENNRERCYGRGRTITVIVQ